MKRILLLLFLSFILIMNFPSVSQEYANVLIEDLYSEDFWDAVAAAHEILRLRISEAYPHIDALYEEKPPIVQSAFLDALQFFEDPDLYERLIDYIERADTFDQEEYPLDPLVEKVHATYLLFLIGYYDTHDYVFELIQCDGLGNIKNYTFRCLEIMIDDPQAPGESQAKDILTQLWDSSADDYYRRFSMRILVDKYGAEMMDRVVSTFENDTDLPTRYTALDYLVKYEYMGLNTLLKSRLIEESESSLRKAIADTLLQHFGEPSDLKAVTDYQPDEPNETVKSLMSYAIQDFIPPQPGDDVPIEEMLDNLMLYVQELIDYQWILPGASYDFSHQAKEIFSAHKQGNFPLAILLTEEFLWHTDEALNNEEITTEGYKFLHYYPTYILQRLQ